MTMDQQQARDQVDKNYDAFRAMLPSILPLHENKYALMKDCVAVGFYSTLEDAYMTANQFYKDQPFSVQKVTDTAVTSDFSHMPCIAGNYNPAVGIIQQVAIFPQSQFAAIQAPPSVQGSQPIPNLTMFAALLDTGASTTCISRNVVNAIGLQPSGKTNMSGSTGQNIVDQFTFCVGLIFGGQQSPGGTFSGQVNIHLVQGCESISHGFGFDVLIGRDILCKGTLSISFDGHYVLSF